MGVPCLATWRLLCRGWSLGPLLLAGGAGEISLQALGWGQRGSQGPKRGPRHTVRLQQQPPQGQSSAAGQAMGRGGWEASLLLPQARWAKAGPPRPRGRTDLALSCCTVVKSSGLAPAPGTAPAAIRTACPAPLPAIHEVFAGVLLSR